MATKKRARRNARAGAPATSQMLLNVLHQVWLAGLGAAVRAQRGAPKLFDELVAEGAKLQQDKEEPVEQAIRRLVGDARARVQQTIGEARGQANEALENLEKIFNSRVQRALSQIGIPSPDELAALGKRVDALNSQVSRLVKHRVGVAKARRAESRHAAAAH